MMESVIDDDQIPQPDGEDGDDEIVDEAARRRGEQYRRSIEEAFLRAEPAFDAAQKWLEENGGLMEFVQRQALEVQQLLEENQTLRRIAETTSLVDYQAFARMAEMLPDEAHMEELTRNYTAVLEATAQIPFFEQQVSMLLRDAVVALDSLPNLATFSRLPRLFYPANWGSLADDTNDVSAAVSVMHDEGIPLAWVPCPQIAAALVSAPDATARTGILDLRAPEIREDCLAVLDQVVDPDLKALADLTRQAIGALGTTPEAAQALAANVSETFLREANRRGRMFGASFGYFKAEKVTRRITSVKDVSTVNELRIACVLTPALLALASYNPGTDPVPTTYNRHATAHTADPAQYTRANAVIAVMLATSFLRQAQESGW